MTNPNRRKSSPHPDDGACRQPPRATPEDDAPLAPTSPTEEDARIDENSRGSFPASDPPGFNPGHA